MTISLYAERSRRLRELLVEARLAQGLSQTALANRFGRIQTFVSKYERGERRLDLIEFLEVAEALGIDPVAALRRVMDAGSS